MSNICLKKEYRSLFFIIIFIFMLVCSVSFITVKTLNIRAVKMMLENSNNTVLLPEDVSGTEYSFMPKELSDYIVELSYVLKLDPDLCASILMQENPDFNANATHNNSNGTIDIGLWQLNDRYLWSVFYKEYWTFNDIEFNPFNWKNNTYIALNHIKQLENSHKTFDDTIMAYNCGSGAVINHEIPETTRRYLANVKNNYQILKSSR